MKNTLVTLIVLAVVLAGVEWFGRHRIKRGDELYISGKSTGARVVSINGTTVTFDRPLPVAVMANGAAFTFNNDGKSVHWKKRN